MQDTVRHVLDQLATRQRFRKPIRWKRRALLCAGERIESRVIQRRLPGNLSEDDIDEIAGCIADEVYSELRDDLTGFGPEVILAILVQIAIQLLKEWLSE